MPSIATIQHDLSAFDTYARKHYMDAGALQAKWKQLFSTPLTSESAKSFATYYKEMRSKSNRKSTRKSGGALSGAPLDYGMVPGANVQVYGRFPVEADTDPATIRDLDVYFQDSLTKGCGIENSSLHVPVEMGSNKVGGKRSNMRKSRANRKNSRKTTRKNRKAAKNSRKNRSNRKTYRRHRGGDLTTSLLYHPYISSVPSGTLQNSILNWEGTEPAVPVSGNPTVQTWNYNSHGTAGIINPGLVTPITSNFGQLASPPPWQVPN